VARLGATCSANTCGNLKLHQYIATEAAMVPGLGKAELTAFGRNMARATGWAATAFSHAPAALRSGIQQGLARQRQTTARPVAAQATRPALPHVSGYRMSEKVYRTAATVSGTLPISLTPVVLVLLAIATGFLLEAMRSVNRGIS
jgi:hypothetical protein